MKTLINTPHSGVICGSRGFRFEFKLKNGSMHFIRYRDQLDRDCARVNTMPVFVYFRDDLPEAIRRELSIYTGVTKRVIKSAVQFVNANL